MSRLWRSIQGDCIVSQHLYKLTNLFSSNSLDVFSPKLQIWCLLPFGSLKNLERKRFLAGPESEGLSLRSFSLDRSWGWSESDEYDPASFVGDLVGDRSAEVTKTSSDPWDSRLISDRGDKSSFSSLFRHIGCSSFLAGQDRSRGCIWISTILAPTALSQVYFLLFTFTLDMLTFSCLLGTRCHGSESLHWVKLQCVNRSLTIRDNGGYGNSWTIWSNIHHLLWFTLNLSSSDLSFFLANFAN